MKPETAGSNDLKPSFSPGRFFFEAAFFLCLFTVPLHLGGVYLWSFSLPIGILALTMIFYRPAEPWGRASIQRLLSACLAALALSSIFSQIPYRIPAELLRAAAACLGYFATVEYCRGKRHLALRLCTFIAFFGAALSLVGLLQYANGLPKSWWHKPYFLSSVYVNHNHFAGLIEILLPLTLGASLAEKSPAKKTLLIYCAALMAAGFVLSLSRGGIVAMAVGLFVFVSTLTLLGLLKRASWIFFGFVMAAVVGVFVFGVEPVMERFNSIQHVIRKEESFNRSWFWQGALDLALHNPLFGSGPGTFSDVFFRFRPRGYLGRPEHVHNDYLELLADCGIAGFLAVGALIVWIVRRAILTCRRQSDPQEFGVIAGALAAFAALAVHSLVDFNLHIPANLFYAAVAAGMLSALADPHQEISALQEGVHRIFRIAVAGFLVAGGAWMGAADYCQWRGQRAMRVMHWQDAERWISRSIAIYPFKAESFYARGESRRAMLMDVRDGRNTAGLRSEIVRDFEAASILNSYEPYYAHEMIRAKLSVSEKPDLQRVLASVERMVAMDPHDAQIRFLAGKILLSPKIGSAREAEKHLREAILLDPVHQVVPSLTLLWERYPEPEEFQAFIEALPQGRRHYVRFLEKTGRWPYLREPFLADAGIHAAELDAFTQSFMRQPGFRTKDTLELGRFTAEGEREVSSGELFYRNGSVHAMVEAEAGDILLKLKAKSVFVHRAFGMLEIRWDDRLVDMVYVNSAEYREFITAIRGVTAGPHRLSLVYVNDASPNGTGDRNLWIRSVELLQRS